jgi:hypothetical protein
MIPSSMQEENLPNALCNSFHGEYQTHTPICLHIFHMIVGKAGFEPAEVSSTLCFRKATRINSRTGLHDIQVMYNSLELIH